MSKPQPGDTDKQTQLLDDRSRENLVKHQPSLLVESQVPAKSRLPVESSARRPSTLAIPQAESIISDPLMDTQHSFQFPIAANTSDMENPPLSQQSQQSQLAVQLAPLTSTQDQVNQTAEIPVEQEEIKKMLSFILQKVRDEFQKLLGEFPSQIQQLVSGDVEQNLPPPFNRPDPFNQFNNIPRPHTPIPPVPQQNGNLSTTNYHENYADFPTMTLKLDRITIPTFDGDLTQWISFRDQFTDLVHNNPTLTPIVKFTMLRNHLRGLAAGAINGFKLSGADYETAWQIIMNRYNRPDKIIDEYLRRFNELPKLRSPPTASQLIIMANTANQLIRVLPNLGQNVDTWDTWILFNLKERLDRTTLVKWIGTANRRANIKLSEFLDFLEFEASLPTAINQQQTTSYCSSPEPATMHTQKSDKENHSSDADDESEEEEGEEKEEEKDENHEPEGNSEPEPDFTFEF